MPPVAAQIPQIAAVSIINTDIDVSFSASFGLGRRRIKKENIVERIVRIAPFWVVKNSLAWRPIQSASSEPVIVSSKILIMEYACFLFIRASILTGLSRKIYCKTISSFCDAV
jgi:hypothetical protein